MPEFTHLETRREEGVEHVRLNRPEVRNAFNEQLIADITAWAERASRDTELRVAVLSGAGPAFCAGADLSWMARMAGYTKEENIRDATAAAAMFSALNNVPFPVIARIHGAAFGGGAGLAAVADIAIADANASFGFTEVKLGLIPAIIAPYVLSKVGESAVRELFLTGRRFTAERAREIGLVHAVVPVEKLDETVEESVRDVVSSNREAVAAAKGLIRRIAKCSAEEAAPLTAEAIATRRASAEAQELMKRFLNRGRL